MGQPLSSLDNALQILGLLGPARPVLRVGEVCRELDIPKSSVSRLLKTMGEHGLLERERGDLGYVVGRRALELADLYVSRHTLLDLIDLTIDRIVLRFGFAGYAGVLSGRELVVLRVKHGSYPLRLVQQVGTRLPSFDTAIGRALLSRLPEDEADDAFSSGDGPAASERRDELDRVYRCGLAGTANAVIPGIAALGVGLAAPDGREALGFSVSYPTGAVTPAQEREMAIWLREEAAAIAARIGDPYWAGRTTAPLELVPAAAASPIASSPKTPKPRGRERAVANSP
jgi:DNA-binding IclR family transcriptional regulator